MTVGVNGRQRRQLVGGALGLLAVDVMTASFPATHDGDYLERLRLALGLEAATDACSHRMRACLQRDPAARDFVAQGMAKLQAAIGEEWHTAVHTIPSLVDEDVRLGRTVLIGGLSLTAVEVALLLG